MNLFSSEKSILNFDKINKTPFQLTKRKKTSSDNVRIRGMFSPKKEYISSKNIKIYNSPNIKKFRKISTKEFFNPNKKLKLFSLSNPFRKKTYRRLSLKNTKLFSELIRNSIIKRQNDQEKFKVVIRCLKHDISIRTNEDINMIKNFIKENKISNKLVFDKSNTENDNLFQAISYEMEYRFLEKGERLFKIAEKVDNIYLIIKGRIEYYEFIEYRLDMTLYKYIKYIYNIYMNVQKEPNDLEKYKLKKNIEENSHIINISLENIPYLICILIKCKLDYMINHNIYNMFIEDFEEMVNDCKNDPFINLKNINYDKEKRNDDYYIIGLINKIYKNLPKVPKDILKQYYSLLYTIEEHYYNFKRYVLKKVGELKDGDYLNEDNSLDKDLQRKCTVIALEDTHLGCIDYDLYFDIINTYRQKIKEKEAKFLKDSFYFKKISLQYFIKNFFSDFTYEELTHGNNILMQNQSIENLYFLKEGIIEIYTSKSVIELFNLVKKLAQILKINNNEETKKELLNMKNNLFFYGKIHKIFTKNTTTRLLIIANTDILGLESYLPGLPYFYNCKVISDNSKFYKISVDKIDKLFNCLKEGKQELISDANKRLGVLYKRLTKIINTRINYFNKYSFYSEQQKILLTGEETIPEGNNLMMRKTFISSYKLKDLFNLKNNKTKEEDKSSSHNPSKLFHLTYTNLLNKKSNLMNNSSMNNSEENKFAKTQNFLTKKKDASIRNLILNKEKFSYESKNNPFQFESISGFTNSEKKFNLKKSLMNKINETENEKIINKKIYTIKPEIKILKTLGNVLEEELLLFHKKKFGKKEKNSTIIIKPGDDNIKKSKTLIISKNFLEEEFKNEYKIPSPKRRFSIKIGPNLDFSLYSHSNSINRQFSESNKKINTNNVFKNSFKNRLTDINNQNQQNNSTQKSLQIFFGKNKNKNNNVLIQNYKYKSKRNKYCITEREKYKAKIYKIFQKKIKDPNYFINTY